MTSPLVTAAKAAFGTVLDMWGEAATFTPSGEDAEDCVVIVSTGANQIPGFTDTQVSSTETAIFWQDGEITGPQSDNGDKFTVDGTDYTVDRVEVQNGAYGKAIVR